MGDFNIDLLECKSSKISQEFFNLSSKLLSYSNRTNRSAFIELLLRWLTTSSLTILADFSLAETLFLILVIIFRSSILQLQRKIDFNKLKNIKYVTKTLCWSLSLWVVWNWLESNNCKWNRIIANCFHRFTTNIIQLSTNTPPWKNYLIAKQSSYLNFG